MADTFLASVLHLSDPHLGETFDYDSRQIPQLVQQVAALFRQGRALGMPHDRTVLAQLPVELDRVRSLLQKHYASYQDFDATVVTGDVLTYPFSTASYDDPAYRWLTSSLISIQQQSDVGLSLDPDRLVVVPGNHDRLGPGKKDCAEYHASRFVTTSIGAPGRHAFQASVWTPFVRTMATANGPPLHVIGLDSNDYRLATIGRGVISRVDLDAIRGKCSDLRRTEKDALIVIALHHVPCDVPGKEYGTLVRFSNQLAWHDLRLQAAGQVKKVLGGSADLVLCGHLHRTFHRLTAAADWGQRAVFGPAPSLSQLREPVHGFNVYVFLRIDQDLWIETWPFVARFSRGNSGSFDLEDGKLSRVRLN